MDGGRKHSQGYCNLLYNQSIVNFVCDILFKIILYATFIHVVIYLTKIKIYRMFFKARSTCICDMYMGAVKFSYACQYLYSPAKDKIYEKNTHKNYLKAS